MNTPAPFVPKRKKLLTRPILKFVTDVPQYVLFQLTGDRVNAVDAFKPGDQVRVDFSLRGREWTSKQGEVKYFNSLDVWTVEAEGAGGGRSKTRDDEPPVPTHEPVFDDDIPF